MIKIPEKINMANLPTKIEKMEKLSKKLGGPDIYIKRDDQTGTEISGNKIRKLEFSAAEALNKGCDTLITCGGIQSNHCRATAAVAVKLGFKCCLLLNGSNDAEVDGNLLLDKLLGAEIYFVSQKEYENRRMEVMKEIKTNMENKGLKPYIIPEGASNGIGGFGYYKAIEEIMLQEREMEVHFDGIVIAAGSGGTYSGLLLGSRILNYDAKIYGVNVCQNEKYFKDRIYEILHDSMKYIDVNLNFSKDEINIIDGYVGRGYALSREEELEFIKELAKLEGIILDPVYTGKAMYGLVQEIKKRKFSEYKNLLFIHTGGIFGIFPQRSQFRV
ncbi:D-cysteine desulfhydrase family protein [Clostridium kluyveri]|uniref:D-cysteine desulfhydrase n=1 Tax=Clostridium kluyveri TaxID=1534 RepID=A0A1L5F4A8_CLOKL|nr:D-cysteine desulfhydrase family protein [Clostridium kluyveri]APM37833.1 D-cysteine desulfhydrase [Clostridium kluyveri]UZQ52166.1 D-cysteine desulfhydrase family protein [Clostridium kluyveri]